MYAKRRSSIHSCSSPRSASFDDCSTNEPQSASIYPVEPLNEELRKLSSSSMDRSKDSGDQAFLRNRIYPNLDQTKEPDYDTANEGESDEELEGEEYSRILSPYETSSSFFNSSRQVDDDNNGSSKILLFMIVLVILLTALQCFFGEKTETKDVLLESYRRQITHLLKKDYPYEGAKTMNILRLMGEKLIIQENVEPYVVLIAGQQAPKFADDIMNIFSNVTHRDSAVNRIILSETKRRAELDEQISESLSKQNKAVILNGIEKLRGDTPLSLHSACDAEHSPYRSSLILLTINRAIEDANTQCEITVSSLLSDEWQSEYMDKDRISPILSRITSFVICLRNQQH